VCELECGSEPRGLGGELTGIRPPGGYRQCQLSTVPLKLSPLLSQSTSIPLPWNSISRRCESVDYYISNSSNYFPGAYRKPGDYRQLGRSLVKNKDSKRVDISVSTFSHFSHRKKIPFRHSFGTTEPPNGLNYRTAPLDLTDMSGTRELIRSDPGKTASLISLTTIISQTISTSFFQTKRPRIIVNHGIGVGMLKCPHLVVLSY